MKRRHCWLRLRPHKRGGPCIHHPGGLHWWTDCLRCGKTITCGTNWGGPR